jgi:hypothetical protein
MSRTINVHCWIHGEDSDQIFIVKIAATKTVAALKKAIKDEKQHAFQEIDANTLVLRRVSIQIDENLERNLDKLDPGDGGQLSSGQKLSSVFSDQPTDDCLDIVIRSPTCE